MFTKLKSFVSKKLFAAVVAFMGVYLSGAEPEVKAFLETLIALVYMYLQGRVDIRIVENGKK